MPFESIIGQEQPKEILRRMLRTGIMPQAFIFYGISGIGKRRTAHALAKALNCEMSTDDFCDKCSSCQKIERHVHPDVFLLEPLNDKKVITIGQLREMQEQIGYRPALGRWKVVIIEQAESLQSEAANSLLKTLEEPPEKTILILIATSIAGMLPTVLSRCQQIRFLPLKINEIVLYLQKYYGTLPDAALYAAMRSQGSLEKAITILEEGMQTLCRDIARLLSGGTSYKIRSSLQVAQNIAEKFETSRYVFDFLEQWYRDMLLMKAGIRDKDILYNKDSIDMIFSAANRETRISLIQKIKRIRNAQNNFSTGQDIQLALESILLGV